MTAGSGAAASTGFEFRLSQYAAADELRYTRALPLTVLVDRLTAGNANVGACCCSQPRPGSTTWQVPESPRVPSSSGTNAPYGPTRKHTLSFSVISTPRIPRCPQGGVIVRDPIIRLVNELPLTDELGTHAKPRVRPRYAVRNDSVPSGGGGAVSRPATRTASLARHGGGCHSQLT